MKQHDQSLAAAFGGDQRRAVGKRRPGAVGELRVRLGQHLTRDRDVSWNRHSVERAFAREAGELLWLVPAQTAAQDAATAPQFHRHEIIVAARKMRAGEAHEHATIVDPLVQAIASPR